jgi:hypothetical protein
MALHRLTEATKTVSQDQIDVRMTHVPNCMIAAYQWSTKYKDPDPDPDLEDVDEYASSVSSCYKTNAVGITWSGTFRLAERLCTTSHDERQNGQQGD